MAEYIVRETGYPGTLKQEIVGELVRCRDCKWRHDDSNPEYLPCTDWYPQDNFFCAYGEREE